MLQPVLVQIASGEHGKQCDMFPQGSVHRLLKTDRGLEKILPGEDLPRRGAMGPGNNFKLTVLDVMPETKKCPGSCGQLFPKDWPFVETGRKGDNPCCIRCFQRIHIPGSYELNSYYNVLREQIKREYGIE